MPLLDEAPSSMMVIAPAYIWLWLSSSTGASLKFSKLAVQLKLNTLFLRSQDYFLIWDNFTSNVEASTTTAFWWLDTVDFFDCTDAYRFWFVRFMVPASLVWLLFSAPRFNFGIFVGPRRYEGCEAFLTLEVHLGIFDTKFCVVSGVWTFLLDF